MKTCLLPKVAKIIILCSLMRCLTSINLLEMKPHLVNFNEKCLLSIILDNKALKFMDQIIITTTTLQCVELMKPLNSF